MNVTSGRTDQLDNMLGLVVDEYLECRARGESPDVEKYARKHPQLADVIRVSLRALDLASGSLSSCGVGATEANLLREQTLGDFHILDELGRGGMGVVFEAEQISMGRRVALKVLPFAAMIQEKALHRFRNEVRAAALLDHPNIVSIYSVGEERGVHYYAMQLIRGQTLAQVIGQLAGLQNKSEPLNGDSISEIISASKLVVSRGSAGVAAPTEDHAVVSMSPLPVDNQAVSTRPEIQGAIDTLSRTAPRGEFYRSVARLGIQAAAALQHAHDQGIMHRDIKPGNMMLDANARVHITDFGLARIEADAGVTMTGDLIGTLRYMAPEQALGKRVVVDHRADIYSLGVTLYELLTLQPAFDQPNRPALLKQIAFEMPQPPRRIQRSIPGELETIVLKAMAKNPGERYESAVQLAEDLESFLEHRPIKAKRPTLIQTATKWCIRHQAISWSAALLLVVLTVGSTVASILIWQERGRTSVALDLAEAHLNTARQAIDSLLVDMSEQLEDTPAATNVQRNLLENALRFYQNFPKEASEKPEIRYEMALAFQRAGEINWKLGRSGDRRKGFELYEKAASIFKRLVEEYPAVDEYRLGLARTYRLQAHAARVLNPDAVGQFCQRSEDLLEPLLAKNRQTPAFQGELAKTLLERSTFQEDEDLRDECITRAMELLRDLVNRFPRDPLFADYLSEALAQYAEQLELNSEYGPAENARRESLAILEQLVDGYPENRNYRRSLAARWGFLGLLLSNKGRHEESGEAFAKANEVLERLVKDYPNIRTLREMLLWTLGNHRDNLLQRRMLPEARQVWERFLRHRRAQLEYDNRPQERDRFQQGQCFLVKALDSYGTILYELGKVKLAQEAWQESLTLARQLATENPESLDDQAWFAWISVTCPFPELRDLEEAARAAAKAVELDDDADALVALGWCQCRLMSWQSAVIAFERAEGRSYGATHEADRELGLAASKWHMGHEENAAQHYNRAKQLLGQDGRRGTYPYVSRRLSAEVGRLLGLENESQNRQTGDAD